MLSVWTLRWPMEPPMVVKPAESEPGLQTFWTDTGVVLDCCVFVAYASLNVVVPRCVTCSITSITGDLHVKQNLKLHECTSQM